MPGVVVDANVLIAARLSRDQNRGRGTTTAQGIDPGSG
jgi:hypothetical protein